MLHRGMFPDVYDAAGFMGRTKDKDQIKPSSGVGVFCHCVNNSSSTGLLAVQHRVSPCSLGVEVVPSARRDTR